MRFRRTGWSLGAALIVVALASAGPGRAEDVAAGLTVGIQVGERAPDFALEGQTGSQVRLADLLKKGPVAVVFSRSVAW
ncbi:MAG: hypothetical protein ABI609_06840 [Acidobacteriota bacterium]